jgi:L-asparagine transporter-like permease
MLAAMFGLGRMIRSLADEGHAPKWLKDNKDVPHRGILFSGFGMLIGLGLGMLLPRVYLFLISAGGFALLFTYAVIMATHIRFRKKNGCPPEGKCQMPGYPYTSWIGLISMIIIILSMPFISGQGSGLIAGLFMVGVYSVAYMVLRYSRAKESVNKLIKTKYKTNLSTEFSDEISEKEVGTNEEKN